MDQGVIDENIKRLANGQRGYLNAMRFLRGSGQYAVPLMISHLRNPQDKELHGPIREALVEMGRSVLAPLCTATESHDPTVLVPVITALGRIKYDVAVPYIVRAATDPKAGNKVRTAAERALQDLNQN